MKKKNPNPIPKHRRHGKQQSGKVKTAGPGKFKKSSNWKEVK